MKLNRKKNNSKNIDNNKVIESIKYYLFLRLYELVRKQRKMK